MSLFPEEPVFVVGQAGFDTVIEGQKLDVLGRKPLGQKLTELVDRIDQPLVIALDGGWGSGKSHFLKLWTGAHSKELEGKAEVIYFDAFEHDFLDDPLVSMVSRLTSERAEKTWGTKAIEKVKKAAFPLAKLAARVGLAAATAGVSEIANAVGDAALGKAADAADATIDQFWKTEANRIAAMQGFRQALTDLTAPKAEDEKPRKIVFIVDELDRCRPDYALSMLEIIKHFFAVPNVHFVLGVNLTALENSVKARYGSEIDAQKYLQKFTSLTMTLPKRLVANPDVEVAAYYLNSKLPYHLRSAKLGELTQACMKSPISRHRVNLRDVQRILVLISLLPKSVETKVWGYQVLIIGALFLKIVHPSVYQRFRDGDAVFEEIERSLSLKRPSSPENTGREYIDYGVWAFAYNGAQHIDSLPFDVDVKEVVKTAFRSHGHDFRWPTAMAVVADALESFEIPSP